MIVGHLGDGNFHEAIMYNKKDPAQVTMVKEAVQKMTDRALEMEGTCTVSSSSLKSKVGHEILANNVKGRALNRHVQKRRSDAGIRRCYGRRHEEHQAVVRSELDLEPGEDFRYSYIESRSVDKLDVLHEKLP